MKFIILFASLAYALPIPQGASAIKPPCPLEKSAQISAQIYSTATGVPFVQQTATQLPIGSAMPTGTPIPAFGPHFVTINTAVAKPLASIPATNGASVLDLASNIACSLFLSAAVVLSY